jgi:hypothetical protein
MAFGLFISLITFFSLLKILVMYLCTCKKKKTRKVAFVDSHFIFQYELYFFSQRFFVCVGEGGGGRGQRAGGDYGVIKDLKVCLFHCFISIKMCMCECMFCYFLIKLM